jgi:hypothetical protein
VNFSISGQLPVYSRGRNRDDKSGNRLTSQ